MKNKKGFTLIELLAVIVILGIIMTIATTNVLKSIKQTKIRTRYIAAKDITKIAEAYLETKNKVCVKVSDLILEGYLNTDVTNPANEDAKNISDNLDMSNQFVCKSSSYKEQSSYDLNNNVYAFDGYCYSTNGICYTYDANEIFKNAKFTTTDTEIKSYPYYKKSGLHDDKGSNYINMLVERTNYATLEIKLLDQDDYIKYNTVSFSVITCTNKKGLTGTYDFEFNDTSKQITYKPASIPSGSKQACKKHDIEIKSSARESNNYINIKVTHGNEDSSYSVWLYFENVSLKNT